MRELFSDRMDVRLWVAAATAVAGVIVMCLVLRVFEGGASGRESVQMIGAAFCGAAVGGSLMSGFFGRRRAGITRALPLLGFLGATFIGSALGGVVWSSMSLPLENYTLFDFLTGIPSAALLCVAVVMGMTPVEAPWTVLIWLALAAGVNLVAARVRAQAGSGAERNRS